MGEQGLCEHRIRCKHCGYETVFLVPVGKKPEALTAEHKVKCPECRDERPNWEILGPHDEYTKSKLELK